MRAAPAITKSTFADIALTAEDAAFVERLREKFAARIHFKHAQIKLIEQLMSYLMSHYPDDWQQRVFGFLQQLFPGLADALYDKYERLNRYNDWLRVNREVLLGMPGGDRRQALWTARHEAFGEDAEEIFAAQRRSEQVREALVALESAQGVPVEQKLATYLDAIREAYGADANRLIETRQTELMNSFLTAASVQTDLQALSTAERDATLRDIRTAMGMDAAGLARWETLDRTRDSAWNSGEHYMAERERIRREHDGAEETEQMRQLQDQSFGAEAETIRQEEAAGFYRYGHQRRIGRE